MAAMDTGTSSDLDLIERRNAGEWDEESVDQTDSVAGGLGIDAITTHLPREFVKEGILQISNAPVNSCTFPKDNRRVKTCRFWATGNCHYAAENCGYLHGYTTRSSKILPPRREQEGGLGYGVLIKSLTVSDHPKVAGSLKIESCNYLASYNWLSDLQRPTILVPGSPPVWMPSLNTKHLKEDSGNYFRDVNSAFHPQYIKADQRCCARKLIFSSYPIEPVFRALFAMHPNIDVSVFNVVGCNSTLGNLLRFAGGVKASFSFTVDRVGDTVFLIRKESSPQALIRNIRGYGHSFPETHTSWEPCTKGSVSHQRVIQYVFGGLRFLVRSESDGYLKREAGLDVRLDDAADSSKIILQLNNKDSESENISLLDTLRISGESTSCLGSLHIEVGGRQIPQHAIFDLKTRAKRTRRPIDMDEVYRRLWVNQTPFLIYAEHSGGCFEPRDIHPVSILDGISKWEKDHEILLNRYQEVVSELIMVAKSRKTGKLQVTRHGKGPLEIWERLAGDNSNVLPSDLCNKWG